MKRNKIFSVNEYGRITEIKDVFEIMGNLKVAEGIYMYEGQLLIPASGKETAERIMATSLINKLNKHE